MYQTRTCTICKREFTCTNPKVVVCFGCIMDGSYQAKLDKEQDEQDQNRRDHLAFRKNFCDDDTNPALYEDDESLPYYDDAEEERMMNEEFDRDNDESSGSTDLGNRGGTTFCF